MEGADPRELFAHFRQYDKDGHETDLFNMTAFFTSFDHNYESSGTNFRNRPLTVIDPKAGKWKLPFGEKPENRTVTYLGRWYR